MKELIKTNRFFFVPYTVFLIVCIAILLIFKKSEIHLFINSYHSTFFDFFFRYITHLGEPIFIIALVIILLFINIRTSTIIGISCSVSSIITQIIKALVEDNARPRTYFAGKAELYFVPNVEVFFYNSFPSGHTTAAFSVFLGLAIYLKNWYLKVICLLFAIFVGFSRMYLSQHFLIDVTVGSIIGVSITLTGAYLINKLDKQWLNQTIVKAKR